jgi:hypothetical protein
VKSQFKGSTVTRARDARQESIRAKVLQAVGEVGKGARSSSSTAGLCIDQLLTILIAFERGHHGLGVSDRSRRLRE